MSAGSLVVVGTGIEAIGQLTQGARAHLAAADRVLYLVADPISEAEIRTLNPRCESLKRFYGRGKHRLITYRQMTERILNEVRKGLRVCAAFYGHPGVFALPPHAAVRLARKEGFFAVMLPAISADACLIADLGVDPATDGWQSYEATDFLLRRRRPDAAAALVLWQVGVIGALDYARGRRARGLDVLAAALGKTYSARHKGILYEASPLPGFAPRMDEVALGALPLSQVNPISTLYVPPLRRARSDARMAARLGLPKGRVTCLR